MKVATLCYCLRDGEVLLGMKKEGFGMDKWNGFGGKVEPDEEVEAAARRELEEESGLTVTRDGIKKAAVVSFYFGDAPIFECHVFLAGSWRGESRESGEMRPQWFSVQSLPYSEMWPSDLYWLPAVLQGHTLSAVCHFDIEGTVVQKFEMTRTTF